MTEQELLKNLGSLVSPDRLMECVKAYAAAQVAAKDAEIERLKLRDENATKRERHLKQEIDRLERETKRLWEGVEMLGVLGREVVDKVRIKGETPYEAVKPIHELSRSLLDDSPAPVTEAPKGEPYSISRAKEVFAARHNLTWGGIMHQFEVGSGISKTFSLEEVMEKVAEIYKNEEQE